MSASLDAIIARLQVIFPWNIWKVNPDGSIEPWYEMDGSIVHDLVIKESNLQEQVQSISAQIMNWGRLAAQCKRIWEVTERLYRIWRDGKTLELMDPAGKPDGWKKPTITQCDQMIRIHPEYTKHYEAQERAEEAYNSTLVVQEGFKAKKEMMRAAITRKYENSAPQLNV